MAAVILVPPVAAQDPGLPSSLIVGVYNNPPKISVSPEGQPSGFQIDLLDAILAGTGIKRTYVTGSWEETIERLNRGDIDLALDVAYSDERASFIDFSEKSIITNWAVVYASKNSTIRTFSDLDGKTIAVMQNSIHTTGSGGIVKLVKDYGITCDFLYLPTQEAGFAAVRNGLADAVVVNRLFGLLNEDGGEPYRTSITFNPSQIRYAFRKGAASNKALIALFDEKLGKLQATENSAYHKAFAKYLSPQLSKEKKIPSWLGSIVLLSIALLSAFLLFVFSVKAGKKDKEEFHHFLEGLRSMGDIRQEIVDSTLVAYALFALPLIAAAVRHVLVVAWDSFIWMYVPLHLIAGILALLRKRLKLELKILLLQGLFFFSGTMIIAMRGNSGLGFTYFFLAAIVAIMLYGRRWGIATLAAGLAITIIFAILSLVGVLDVRRTASAYFLSPTSWIFTVMSFFGMFFAIMGGMQKFYSSLMAAVVNLEQRIAERTQHIEAINKDLKKEIDEHMKTESMLSFARQEAEMANKAKSSFFAGISHEIRTPLNAILGYSQILARDSTLSSESHRQVETINASGEHLLGLINEVLEMSRIEAGKAEAILGRCNVATILREVGDLFAASAARKGLAYSVNVPDSLDEYVMSDGSKLKQILINLVGNALKFTDSGSIVVEASSEDIAQRDDIAHRDIPVRRLVFTVTDTGAGIEPGNMAKIFEPFEQTEEGRLKGGTGLGLSISRKYCQLLGGDIAVESQPGKGSRFSFHVEVLPCDMKCLDEPETQVRISSIAGGKAPRILIVDDKAMNRDILARMLEPIGFSLKQADGGQTALETIKSWTPDLVLLDLVMPGLSGKALIQTLRSGSLGRNLKIIVTTASVSEFERASAEELGADALIDKPVMEGVLFSEIRRLTGIEYGYEQLSHRSTGNSASEEGLASRLTSLPAETFLTLRDSIKLGDIEEIVSAAARIADFDPELARTITKMAESFQLESLMKLADSVV